MNTFSVVFCASTKSTTTTIADPATETPTINGCECNETAVVGIFVFFDKVLSSYSRKSGIASDGESAHQDDR